LNPRLSSAGRVSWLLLWWEQSLFPQTYKDLSESLAPHFIDSSFQLMKKRFSATLKEIFYSITQAS
jgi:hypothetical protein